MNEDSHPGVNWRWRSLSSKSGSTEPRQRERSDGNLTAVHRHCHDQIHGEHHDHSKQLGTHDKSPLTEEPCAAKVASTVLKASGGGDPFAEPNPVPSVECLGNIPEEFPTGDEVGADAGLTF